MLILIALALLFGVAAGQQSCRADVVEAAAEAQRYTQNIVTAFAAGPDEVTVDGRLTEWDLFQSIRRLFSSPQQDSLRIARSLPGSRAA